MKKFAIALYDNEAESEDELNFKKNDLFQILQLDYEGMEGWWLCKSIKSNLVGLAAGNRLKLVADDKILLKLNAINNLTSDKLSASSSSSSILSSNSSNSSASSVKSIEIELKTLSIDNNNNKKMNTIPLPAKLKPTQSRPEVKKINIQLDDDDYDYDIPENNKPLQQDQQPDTICSNQQTRKSTSPTIDSGISTCSLVSCNSDISIKSKHLSSSSKSTDDESTSSMSDLKEKFNFKIGLIIQIISKTNSVELTQKKESLFDLKTSLYEFLSDVLKRCKQEHACFHFDLNVFNKFKTIYRQLKEFYLYFESCLNTLTNVYAWKYDIIMKETNELSELMNKLVYLNELIEQMKQLVDKNNFFDYHSQTSSDFHPKNKQDSDENLYEYEYDNSSPINTQNSYEDDYENIYESNYCQINDNITGNSTAKQHIDTNFNHCMTLKKNEEKIKREIRIATTNSNETNRINLVDQMLLKFYLKHIEDNLTELKSTYDILSNQLENNQQLDCQTDSLAHKLAIYGHKLVFICDTLQRNINNVILKSNLNDSSNCLSDSLKVYMIRIKTNNQTSKQSECLIESLNNVLNASNQFKQVIIKYYFKSF